MRNEKQFWTWLRDKLPGHAQRVENAIDRGTPDVNVCHNSIHIWIELKVAENNGKVLLRTEQNSWAFKRSRNGGKVLCIADMHDGSISIWLAPFETVPGKKGYQEIVGQPFISTPSTHIDMAFRILLP